MDIKKLTALCEWMMQSAGEDLHAMVVVDRQGLIIASQSRQGVDEELIGGLSALVEPILKRISTEFQSGHFGTGSFDTDRNRLIFCEAGPNAVLVLIADAMASIDALFPYAYLAAEKVMRIIDDRPVSPVIPDFKGVVKKLEGGKGQRITIEEGTFIFKVILGGDGGVGKTTLVTQFVQGEFEKDYKATIGAQIMKKEMTFPEWNVTVRFTLWDLAGQAQFARVRQTYVAGAKAGFLVYDVTRKDTFENIRNWYKEISRSEKDVILMLIANKIDLDGRVVTTEEGKAMAIELGVPYFETSALNVDIVNEAFKALAFLLVQDFRSAKPM
jgi:Ras-related protein Rab-8A